MALLYTGCSGIFQKNKRRKQMYILRQLFGQRNFANVKKKTILIFNNLIANKG